MTSALIYKKLEKNLFFKNLKIDNMNLDNKNGIQGDKEVTGDKKGGENDYHVENETKYTSFLGRKGIFMTAMVDINIDTEIEKFPSTVSVEDSVYEYFSMIFLVIGEMILMSYLDPNELLRTVLEPMKAMPSKN